MLGKKLFEFENNYIGEEDSIWNVIPGPRTICAFLLKNDLSEHKYGAKSNDSISIDAISSAYVPKLLDRL